ncbi:unnamed protein product [Closterium sp. Yama58-4]|nr:unnamed protein product [Closterium sp. Yama58-4]
MDQAAFDALMQQVAEMSAGMKALTTEVERLREENNELRQARGEARQESPAEEGESTGQAVSGNPLEELTRGFEEEDRQRAAAATTVAVTTIKIKPTSPPPYNPTDKNTTVKGWLFGVEVFFTAANVNDDATRINYAVSLLRGPALEWWRRTLDTGTPTGVTHAADGTSDSANGRASSIFAAYLVTVGFCSGYTASFMALADQVDDMAEAERLDKYISGLKYEIQFELDRCLPEIDARLVDGTPLAILEETRTVRIECGDDFGFSMKFLATTLDGCDVLLGRDWLRRHNPIIDWTTGSCSISKDGKLITLPSWTPDCIESTCVKAITITRHVNRGAQLFAVCLRELAADTDGNDIEKLCAAVPPDLAELIRQYPDIFPDDLPPGLPPERPEDHKIQLEPGAQPTVRTQWRLTQPELAELRSQLESLLEKGFIRPSTSPFAAPILFTPKKDGGIRMCIDYRALNRVTIKSRYPIPRTDDLLDQLRGARYFSKIDLRGGYHQIRVFADDCHKTAFRTRYGSYEFTVMPFGLTNAPSTFQRTMNRVFRDLLDKCVIVYLDDILIFSRTREQHLRDLDAVFKRLQDNRLITKGSKCEFFKQELEFLGHVISRDGIKIDPKKIKTIQEWKAPTNVTELQSFLGFVNYVRRFIPNMAGITGPLTDLLHKDRNFVWGEEAEAAFQGLKQLLVSPPVLRIADPSKPFEVVTDASDFAIGAVLLQDFGNGLQPIAYESRKLQAAERNYPIHDKEMLAIIHAFKLWRCYLTGADCQKN